MAEGTAGISDSNDGGVKVKVKVKVKVSSDQCGS